MGSSLLRKCSHCYQSNICRQCSFFSCIQACYGECDEALDCKCSVRKVICFPAERFTNSQESFIPKRYETML
ncbi:hypothetical protein J437_LFUL019639, partial [Ladona fulva]